MSWQPLLPGWLIALSLALMVGCSLWSYRGRGWPLLARLGACLLVGVLLCGPALRSQAQKPLLPRLVLALDCSASMATHDGAAADRFTQADTALRGLAAMVQDQYRIDWLGISSQVSVGRPATVRGGADGGTCYDDLDRLAGSEVPPTAVVLASDGGDHGVRPPDRALAGAGIPVFVLAVGSSTDASNASVRLEAASDTAFLGQEMPLRAIIHATPDLVGHQTRLVVSDEASKTILLACAVTLAKESVVTVEAPLGSQAGERLFSARLAPLAGEATELDNTAYAAVRVSDRQLRVLLLDGQPYWDTTFALRALRRDRQLLLVSVQQLGAQRLRSGSAPPVDLDQGSFAGIDAVIVGNQAGRLLDTAALNALRSYVSQGGGLVLVGTDAAPEGLRICDPILHHDAPAHLVDAVLAPAGAHLALLPAAADGSTVLRQLAIGAADGIRPLAEVLLGSESEPLVASMPSGAGQVIAVNAEGIWHWSLDGHGEIADRFWRQVVKAVARVGQEPIRPDRPRYRAGATASIALSGTSALESALEVVPPDGSSLRLMPHDGVVSVALPTQGLYRLRRGTATATLIVDADVRELVATARDQERLVRLASATGGEVQDLAASAALAQRLTRRAELAVDAPQPRSLVTSGWWMPLLSALLGCEWWLRRRRYGIV